MSKETNQKETTLQAGLYLVATPIGNLGDITLRALETLRTADRIYCEDTRVSKKLLDRYSISKRCASYHDHSTDSQRDTILTQIKNGEAIALISDAGMPLISDPGYKLVKDVQAAGLHLTTLPGANAPLAALQLSGLPSDQFSFLGFLPNKQKARRDALAAWAEAPGTLIAFESAGRLLATLADIDSVLGPRNMAVVREITKKFEEAQTGTPQELLEHFKGKNGTKGEIALVIGPKLSQDWNEDEIDTLLREELRHAGTKDAAAHVAAKSGWAKKDLYARALALTKREG